MRLPSGQASRKYSRWAWVAAIVMVSAVAVYALNVVSSTTDSSRLVAAAGQIQPLMLDVAAAADLAATSGDPLGVAQHRCGLLVVLGVGSFVTRCLVQRQVDNQTWRLGGL